jgi:hypothetical protein
VRKTRGVRVFSRQVTRGARLDQDVTEVVGQGVVTDHEVLRTRRTDETVRVLVEARVSREGPGELYSPAPVLQWRPGDVPWEELASYQARKRRYRALLRAMYGDPETVVDRGYVTQKLGVVPTEVTADRARGRLRIWIAPNPGYWRTYRRILEIGASLVRDGHGMPAGLLGPVQAEDAPRCHWQPPCQLLGLPNPVRVPRDMARDLVPPIRLRLALGRDQQASVAVWKNAIFRTDDWEAFHQDAVLPPGRTVSPLRRTHTFRGGRARLAPPFIGEHNRGNQRARALRVLGSWAKPNVPAGVKASASALYARGQQDGHWIQVFDGGVILGFRVSAPDVASLQALGSSPLKVRPLPLRQDRGEPPRETGAR